MTATRLSVMTAVLAGLLSTGSVLAQHEGHEGHAGHDQAPAAKTPARVGDAYPFATCPISGKQLGTMGDPVVKVYEGREVRYCCGGCPKKFEKDLQQSLAKLDAKIAADQGPIYPLKTSLVTGKDLPEKPFEFVYGNRLIRLGAEQERAEFAKAPAKYLATLDQAVVGAQGKGYPLKECPVSGEKYGGDMGDPIDLVVAGRLVRVCCKDCKKDVEKDPAKFIGLVDAARKGEKPATHEGHEQHKGQEGHGGKDAGHGHE